MFVPQREVRQRINLLPNAICQHHASNSFSFSLFLFLIYSFYVDTDLDAKAVKCFSQNCTRSVHCWNKVWISSSSLVLAK